MILIGELKKVNKQNIKEIFKEIKNNKNFKPIINFYPHPGSANFKILCNLTTKYSLFSDYFDREYIDQTHHNFPYISIFRSFPDDEYINDKYIEENIFHISVKFYSDINDDTNIIYFLYFQNIYEDKNEEDIKKYLSEKK